MKRSVGNNRQRVNHAYNSLNSNKSVNERSKSFTIGKLIFLSINICGLKSKLRFSEFKNLINSYDIVRVQESKLDDLDSVQLPGYEIVFKNRK